jgi:hypothetical protein
MEALTGAFCFEDPGISAGHPSAAFNSYVGTGTGDFDGAAGATANVTFTDAGEPGSKDTAAIVIKDASGATVLSVSGNLAGGNQQAHAK